MTAFSQSPWPLRSLGAICAQKETIDPRRSPDLPFRYVDIGSVSNERFEIVDARLIVGHDAPSRARKRIRFGDVILATTRPYLQTIARVPQELDQQVCSTGFCVLRPSDRVLSEWLFYSVLSGDFLDQITPKMRGANYPAVTDRDVLASEIPLPSIADQQRVVGRIKACMERIDEIEQLRDRAFQEREYLIESMIEAELGSIDGEKISLSSVCSITSSLVDPRDPQYQQMAHVGGANIESKTGQLSNLKTAQEEGLKSSKFTFDPSMVLYNKIRPYLMKVARPSFSGLCSADMYPLTPSEERLTRDFLFYQLMSRDFTEYAIAGSNRAGMPKVNREHLFAYEFVLPPVSIQQQMTERLDAALAAALNLKSELAEAKSETSHLREAVLRKAFAGEL